MKFCVLLLALLASASALQLKDGLGCAICNFVSNVVANELAQNTSIPDIISNLDQNCQNLYNPDWVSQCRAFVSSEAQKLIPYMKENPGANACQFVGACPAPSSEQTPVALGGEIECGVCTFVATRVEGYIAENRTESEIEGFLAKDCRIFSDKSWVATCQGLVDEFAPEIIQLAEQKYPADVICQDIKFCSAADAPSSKKIAVPAPVQSGDDDIKCHVCEWIATVAEKYIEENKTETEIIDGLAAACDVLVDKSWISECKDLVEENGEEIVQYLLEKESPEEVCEEVQACPSNFSSAIKQLIQGSDDVECSVCHWLTTLGERYVEQNKTESEIIAGLAESCDILIDKSWITECHTLVEDNGELIVTYLLNKESPQVICQQIGACANSTSSSVVRPIDESVECSVCNWLATLGEHYVEQNKTESEIIDAMTIACDVLIDKTFIAECHTLVEDNGELIVQYLLNKEDPEVICEQIGACPNNTTYPASPFRVLTPLIQQILA